MFGRAVSSLTDIFLSTGFLDVILDCWINCCFVFECPVPGFNPNVCHPVFTGHLGLCPDEMMLLFEPANKGSAVPTRATGGVAPNAGPKTCRLDSHPLPRTSHL